MINSIEDFVAHIGNVSKGTKLVKKKGKTYHTVTADNQPDYQLIIRFVESENKLNSVWFDLTGSGFNMLQEKVSSKPQYKRALLVLLCKEGSLQGTYIVNTRKPNPKVITDTKLLDNQKRLDMYLPRIPLDRNGKWKFNLERSPTVGHYITVLGEDKGNKIPVERNNLNLLDSVLDDLYRKDLLDHDTVVRGPEAKRSNESDRSIQAVFGRFTKGNYKIGKAAQHIFNAIDEDPVLFQKVLAYVNSDASRFRIMYGAKILRPEQEGRKDHLGKDRYYARSLPNHNYYLSNHWIKGQDDEPLEKMLVDLALI
ncbi:hypothetical protein [Pontibacter sp. BAB1700]|uniref:hypothetical protein n=1 Tax=Pontibacter sp. BAB1700 TaxID=1144253 RepID=UPI00026BCD80|nr:hypothetical protein [Pontibacter sp. BAB1700]EJF10607.1 hypothetical protein O71_08208 [Pontibacter sp. BAB1700]